MICFVTDEILPGMRGGIGFFLEEALGMLEREGLSAGVLVVSTKFGRRAVEKHLRSVGLGARVFGLDELAGPEEAPAHGGGHAGLALSWRLAAALKRLCAENPVEVVEFLDLLGYGFAAIRMKRTRGEFAGQVLTVRAHGTTDMIHGAERRHYGLRKLLIDYFMERYAVRHADVLLASTPSVLREYGQRTGRSGPGVVSSLPVRRLTPEPLPLRPAGEGPRTVLTVGTIQAQKGMDTFVRAAVRLIENGLRDVRFVVMGRDFPTSPRCRSVARELELMVPPPLRDRFEFRVGYYGPDELLRAARECAFAALTSRWEAFCLVAHELRWVGTPLVLSPIGAFRDGFREGEDAAFYDGTVDGLADVMGRMLSGGLKLRGRADLPALYVDAPALAAVYRGLRAPERPAPSEARPLVSVVVAGGPAEETVRSVLASTYENIEVIAPPDAHGAQDERVHPLEGWRVTTAAAFNAGLEAARGELVCCLPAGWTCSSDYIAEAVGALQLCPDAAYVGSPVVGTREPAYGLDPVLVTVEDGSALAGAVMRRRGARFGEEAFALEHWDLAHSLAERGLTGEVLPRAHLTALQEPPEKQSARYHLRQSVLERHEGLLRRHATEVAKAQVPFGPAIGGEEEVTAWMMTHMRGLRLLRLALLRCVREGPRALAAHALDRARKALRGGGTP